jgi:hypothetical protein
MQSDDGVWKSHMMCIRKAQQQLTGRPCGHRCSSSASAMTAVAGREALWWRRPLDSVLPALRAASKHACAAWRRPWGGLSGAGLAGRPMSRLVAVSHQGLRQFATCVDVVADRVLCDYQHTASCTST